MKNKHDKPYTCTVDDCSFATFARPRMVMHSQRNHTGYKCLSDNCTYFIMDKLDSIEHKLAKHTDKKVSTSDKQYMDVLMQVTCVLIVNLAMVAQG